MNLGRAPALTVRPANHLLASLSQQDFELLEPHLEKVQMPLRMSLEIDTKDVEWIYFLERGVASVVARVPKDREIEIGLIGCEGMTGVTVVMGNHRSTNLTYVQVAGSGVRIPAADLRLALRTSISLQTYFLQFAQAFMVQVANTALANGMASIEERLARWLLMVHDRTHTDELRLTHEFIATMLAVRRPGVTTALKHLVSLDLITVKRSAIVVRDRAGLRKITRGTYGLSEREYRRLIGWKPLNGE
jgi:CRP-like cAMP-binding protein